MLIRLNAWLVALFGGLRVRIQLPIEVEGADAEYNEPEPDAAVTAEAEDAYPDRHPGPADLLLVVEVSDTAVRYDLSVKAALYAAAGVPEYWVVDIMGRLLFVHRRPGAEGYGDVFIYSADEMIAAPTHPDEPVRVGDLIPYAEA